MASEGPTHEDRSQPPQVDAANDGPAARGLDAAASESELRAGSLRPGQVQALQRTAGNAAVARLIAARGLPLRKQSAGHTAVRAAARRHAPQAAPDTRVASPAESVTTPAAGLSEGLGIVIGGTSGWGGSGAAVGGAGLAGGRLARQPADGGLPPGGAPVPTADPDAPTEALRLNGLAMPALLTGLDGHGRQWVSLNRDALVRTPGVDPPRMALAVEAVLAGPDASDERLTVIMGEMQAMGLPDDQQDAVARFCGAFGLRAPGIVDAYVKGAAGLKGEWSSLLPTERARRLGALAAAELVAVGVPAPTSIDVEPISDGGQWDRIRWRIVVSEKIGSLKSDADLFVRAAATLYHEARHAEQDFTILRALAGQHRGAAEISAAYAAPMPVIQAALVDPIGPQDPRARKAGDWLVSAGAPLAYQDRPVERDAHGAGNTVADRLRDAPPPDRTSQLRDPWIPTVKQQTQPALARMLMRQDAGAGTDEEQLDSPAWVERHVAEILPALATQLQTVELPTGASFVTWSAGSSTDFVTAVLRSALPPASGLWARLVSLAAPASPLDTVDRARNLEPGHAGPVAYDARVVDALHGLLIPRLGESVARVLARYVVAANQAALRKEQETQATPAATAEPEDTDVPVSHPFDPHVRTALHGRVQVDLTAFRQANPSEAKAHEITKLRPVTGIALALEEPVSRAGVANWLRVGSPVDATAEEVAAAIYGDAAQAVFVTAAAPNFGFDEKRLVPDLRARWDKAAKAAGVTKDPSGLADPGAQALAGPLADTVAKQQAAGLKPTGATPDEIVQRMRSAYDLVGDMKKSVVSKPLLAGQAAPLDAVIARLDTRSKEAKSSPEQAAAWDAQSAAQLGVITQAAEGVRSAVGAADAFAGEKTPQDEAARAQLARVRAPLLTLTQAFVGAVVVSDLAETGQARLNAAREQLRFYPVAVSEAVLATVEDTIARIEAGKEKSVPDKVLREIRGKAAELRAKLLKARDTLVTDPGGARALMEQADQDLWELRTRATLVTNMDACDQAIKALDAAVGNAVVSGVAQTAQDYIAAKADMASWFNNWHTIYEAWASNDPIRMGWAEGKFKELATSPEWVGKFERIRKLLQDDAAVERWVGVAVMLGIAAVSAGMGALAGGGVLGTVAEAGAFTGMSAALLEKDPSVGGLLASFAENLATIGLMRGFGFLFKAVAGEAFAGSVLGQGVQLSALTVGTAAARLAAADADARAAGGPGVDQATANNVVALTFVETLAMVIGQHAGHKLLAESPVRRAAGLERRFAALDAADEKLRVAADTLRTQAGARANLGSQASGELDSRAKTLVADEGAGLTKKQELLDEIRHRVAAGEKIEGLTPQELADLQAGIGKQAGAAKLAAVMLELKPAGPGRYICSEGKLAGIRGELTGAGYKETASTTDPVTNAPTVTFAAPEGGEAITITETKGEAGKVTDAPLPPVSSGAVWDLGRNPRGLSIETAMGKLYRRMGGGVRRMPKGFEGIDYTAGGEITVVTDAAGNRIKEVITGADGISEKSLDLRREKDKSVKPKKDVKKALNDHLNDLFAFEHYELSGIEVRDLRSKILNVSIGPGEPTPEQWEAINEFAGLAAHNNIYVNIIRF